MKRQPRIPREVPAKSAVKDQYKRERTAAAHVRMVKQIGVCSATGREMETDSHHLMRGVERGTSYSAAGRYVIPLGRDVHDEIQPNGNPEAILMQRYGLDARALADALWSVSGDEEAMRRITIRAAEDARRRLKQAA